MAAKQAVGLVFDDRYLTHNAGLALINYDDPYPFASPIAHVSSPELVGRAKHLLDLVGLTDRMVRIDPEPVPDDLLTLYHTAEHIARVGQLSAGSGGDTGRGAPIGPGGDRIARLAVGGTVAAMAAVLSGQVRGAYALVRPPGHHAMADHGMGFCVYGNVVIAAKQAQRAHGAERVLILDWDVHHGNGTQDAFWADPSVLFVSVHQDNLFPVDWGAPDQVGTGAGKGFTVNVPLPAGTGNRGYLETLDRIVVPIGRQFKPDLIFISAGQDASVMDPLGRMCVTADGYRLMMERMQALADEVCEGRIVVTQEGGYAPTYAPYCTAAIAHALAGDLAAGLDQLADPYGTRAVTMSPSLALGLDAERALDQVVAVQRRYWSLV
ncbi:MAG: class II histone deacetylase [Chloroflexota bacterium]|nr:class II histone deacetylase [Chloroflexota bacterium]